MGKFNYKDIGKKIGWNFSTLNYIVEQSNDFDYYKEVVKNINNNTILLDIGCGSADKTLRFYSMAKKVHFADYELEMLKKAKSNADKYYGNNLKTKKKFVFETIDSRSKFKYASNHFDLVVSRHCGANMEEVYRVLKNNGIFISEDVSSDDCQELKSYFKRGQGYNQPPLYKEVLNECLNVGFSEVKLIRFDQIEYYKTIDDLKFLLSHTPILNGYDETKDDVILNEYVKNFTTTKGIKLTRKLYAFVLKK